MYFRCNTESLSSKVVRSRWRMLGHVLRGPVDGPAFSSLVFAINTLNLPGRRGRPQSNLFSLILNDLCERDLFLNNIFDLYYIRNIAYNKNYWQNLQILQWYKFLKDFRLTYFLGNIRLGRCDFCDYPLFRDFIKYYNDKWFNIKMKIN